MTGYDVLRNGSKVASVAGTSFTDTGVQPSTTYTYTVDAFDAARNTSMPSAPASVTTPDAPAGACGSLASAFNPSSPPTYTHVVVIMDENLSYNGWAGSSAAPYSNGLAGQCALATNAVAATHPSQPNYVAPLSGVLQIWNALPSTRRPITCSISWALPASRGSRSRRVCRRPARARPPAPTRPATTRRSGSPT